jgi:transposase
MLLYCGLDVHKRVVEACVLDEGGEIVLRDRFDLTPARLVNFLQQHLGKEAKVVVEATTNTWAIVALVKPHVGEVVVSNPLLTKAIAQAKVKTDKVDALVLAQLLRCDYLPTVWQPDEATQELRRLTSRRSSLVADRTGMKNRLHSVLAMRLVQAPVADLFNNKGLEWLRTVELDAEARWLVDSDVRLLEHIEQEIALLDGILGQKAYADEDVKLLMTLPGVDVAVAQAVRAAIGDPKRFHSGDHCASFLGLVPSTKQSAEHCYHGPITKAGNGHARWLLIQAAQHVRLHPGPLGVFFRRLAKRKNYNVAVVATARKLVVIGWQLLIKREPYRYAQPKPTEQKLQRLRVRATGQKRKTGPVTHKPAAKGRGATRRVRSLAGVYASEGLPALPAAPAGEARTVAQTGTTKYVASLQQEYREPRKSKVVAVPGTEAPPANVSSGPSGEK